MGYPLLHYLVPGGTMKPKIPTELPGWMLTCPRFHHYSDLEHPAVLTIPSETSEERVMFPEDLLADMGKVPWPEAVYVLANEESGTHAVTRNQRGLVCYETITRAKEACLRPKNSHFTPNSVTTDEAIVIALGKEPELTCIVLFREEGDEPLVWYIR